MFGLCLGMLVVFLAGCSTYNQAEPVIPPTIVPDVPTFETPPVRTSSGPIEISRYSDVVIENLHISNPDGICVAVSKSSNVTIRNSTIGPCGEEAVYFSDIDRASVTDNYITESNNGVLVHRSESIVVDGNEFVNAGRNFVQFDKVSGAGSSISDNRGQNELGASNAEDLINVYQSDGTPESPIRVIGNYLKDGGPSGYGSGIMLGDAGGSHQIAEGNHLVNPGQVGIGVASGDNISVVDNLIYSSQQPWSNVGLYVWNQYDSGCSDIVITGNRVNWTAAEDFSNPYWEGGGCSDLSVTDNDWEAPIGPEVWSGASDG